MDAADVEGRRRREPGRASTFRRVPVRARLKPGDRVIRRHRLLKTVGTLVRFDGTDVNGASRAWIRWDHRETLPNPSLESVDDLEAIDGGAAADPSTVEN